MVPHHDQMPMSQTASNAPMPRSTQALVWGVAALSIALPPLAAFAARLRDEVDMATVAADLDATVRAAVAPTGTSLWLRAGGQR